MSFSLFARLGDRNVKHLALAVLALATFGVSSESQAVPAFARQTNMACTTCHTTFPALNSFGRAFKSGGYTMIGSQAQVVGEDLGLPVTLNSTLVTKIRYQKTNGSDKGRATNNGEFQFPDEGALLVGGRAGEHVGFLLELATLGGADTGSGETEADTDPLNDPAIIGQTDTGSGEFSLFASYKMPIVHQVGGVNLLVVPFSTDALGTSYGFELLNTGAARAQRVGEDRAKMMAQQWLGDGDFALGAGAAGGFAFVASHSMGYINYTMWQPTHGNWEGTGFAPYVRAVATPRFGNWDMGLGVQYYTGDNSAPSADGYVVTKTEGQAVDFQALGAVGSLPVQVYAAYGRVPKSEAGKAPNLFNSTAFDKNAYSLHGTLGLTPGVHLLAGYRHGDTGAAANNIDNVVTVGAMYHLAQNVQLQLNHTMGNGSYYEQSEKDMPGTSIGDTRGKNRTTLMLFSGF